MKKISFLLLCALSLSACSILKPGSEPMPSRDETFSYFGPGSERILKGGLPDVTFPENSANLDDAAEDVLDKIAEKVRVDPNQQILLAGSANDAGTAEFDRVLSEQRAQTVRQGLIVRGLGTERIHTVSYGNEFESREGSAGRRVEVGLVAPPEDFEKYGKPAR